MNPSKKDPQLDIYKEQLIELRLKVLENLEANIKSGTLDSWEALSKFAAITALPKVAALNYVRGMGQVELWTRAE